MATNLDQADNPSFQASLIVLNSPSTMYMLETRQSCRTHVTKLVLGCSSVGVHCAGSSVKDEFDWKKFKYHFRDDAVIRETWLFLVGELSSLVVEVGEIIIQT